MSPLVTWSGQLEIGVSEIDAHHRTLVDLLNELHATVHQRRGADACRRAVEKLHRCAFSHLEVEEKLMRSSGYSSYEASRGEVRELTRLLDEMLARMDGEESNIFHGLDGLRTWLLAHVCRVDPNNSITGAFAQEDGSPPGKSSSSS